jgi:uncharacterized RDD family membrane protein YckC
MDKDYFADAYCPPGSDVNAAGVDSASSVALAERGTRLWAASIDGILISIPLLPVMVVGIYYGVQTQMGIAQAGVGDNATQLPSIGVSELMMVLAGAAVLGLLGALGIAVYQWVLISRTGQSLGKKWTGIRIERLDGSRIDFGSGVFMRNWLPKLIGAVPYLGAVFHLLDCLFIFRDDRRCIHDHIAGTRVVRHPR